MHLRYGGCVAAASLLAAGLAGCDNDPGSVGAVKAAEAAPVSTAPTIKTYSRQQFMDLVSGQPKSVVRDRLGPPSNVDVRNYDDREMWFYWPDKVRIYDPEAGIVLQGSASVTFSISNGTVVDVGF